MSNTVTPIKAIKVLFEAERRPYGHVRGTEGPLPGE